MPSFRKHRLDQQSPLGVPRPRCRLRHSQPDWGFGDGPIDARKTTLLAVIEDTAPSRSDISTTSRRLGALDPDREDRAWLVDVVYPRLLAGVGTLPDPKMSAGRGGTREFLEALADPTHERHGEMIEWWGTSFDPAEVDIDAIGAELIKLGKSGTRKPRVRSNRTPPVVQIIMQACQGCGLRRMHTLPGAIASSFAASYRSASCERLACVVVALL